MRIFLRQGIHWCASLALMLAGCGYHAGQSNTLSDYASFSIPYIEGDVDGDLTSAIAEAISSSGPLEYLLDDGAILLIAKIINFDDENIGFRYDRHKDGKLNRSIIPVESRLALIVEFSIIESASGKVLEGPLQISATIDIDHDYNGSKHSNNRHVNRLSLGQLTNADAAFKAAEYPLNRALAKKLADYLNHTW